MARLLDTKIIFVHGLEAGVNGPKSQYLRRHFDIVEVPDLKTGSVKSNSIFVSSLVNLPHIFSGEYFLKTARYMLSGGVDVLRKISIAPDVVIASSMGGAIALEAVRQGLFPNVPLLIFAPALKRVLSGGAIDSTGCDDNVKGWYNSFNEQMDKHGKDRPTIIVAHGTLDSTVRLADSRELCDAIGATLVEVPDGEHSLNAYLLDDKHDGAGESDQLKHLVHRVRFPEEALQQGPE